MASIPSARLTALMLASSLTLNAVLVSCGNEPTAPLEATSEVLEKLAEMTERLDSIQSKIEQHSDAITTRIDSLESRVTFAVGGETTLPALQVARVDSILNLASFIARDVSSGGWELCGGLKLKAEGGSETAGEAEGKARGSLGAWAGTGGFAGADLKAIRAYKIGLGIEGEFGIGGCVPLGGEAPPARLTQSARLAAATAADLRSSLTSIANQVGLTESKVTTGLSVLGTTLTSPGSLSIEDAVSLFPLPPSLANKLNNPLGSLSSELPGKITAAVTALCTGNWGSVVATPISTACDRINNGPPDIGGLFTMMEQFPLVQTSLSTVTTRVGSVCTRINAIGVKSLTIPNPLDFGPTNLFGPERLFPSYTLIGC